MGGYLDRLETDYSLLGKIRPFGAKPNGRVVKYRVEDNFLDFWFRFVFANVSALQLGNIKYVRDVFERDYRTFSGHVLEKYFRKKFAESCRYTAMGSYWESGNMNEIDIVAEDAAAKRLVFAEVKRDPRRIRPEELKRKSAKILMSFKDYEAQYQALSLDDM